ncbi:Synphilin-1, partial [Armadillidium vulgare]
NLFFSICRYLFFSLEILFNTYLSSSSEANNSDYKSHQYGLYGENLRSKLKTKKQISFPSKLLSKTSLNSNNNNNIIINNNNFISGNKSNTDNSNIKNNSNSRNSSNPPLTKSNYASNTIRNKPLTETWANNVDAEGLKTIEDCECPSHNTLLPTIKQGKEDFVGKKKAEKQLEATPKQNCTGILHNDPFVCSCCACHVLIKKGCERRNRLRQQRSGVVGATMGDLEGLGVGKVRTGRRSGHQPPFLKTVSIIDTLSELGPEVRQLAEEPSPSTSFTAQPTSSSRSTKPASGTPSVSENKEATSHTLGPPLVSPDFQQYTEKIYDAVTRHPGSSVSSGRIKNQRSRFLPSSVHSERLKKSRSQTEKSNEGNNTFKIRFDDEKVLKRQMQLEQRGRERGRTPDWIKRIFNIAKKGDLLALKEAIADMEETLVRNLSDHAGNNLLHVMAVFGHLSPMAWMLTKHSVLIDALQDENKFGLTPLVCSIKYGHLHIVQWLVENTAVKDKVKCKDGERSLLHMAAKYAQEEIVAWLVEYMMSHEISLDNKDHHGNTALHLASRNGSSRLSSILLQHGADVTLKNDLGQKAWEVCVIRGHLACAEYLCVHESGLALATDLTRREAELEAAMADNHELRINFKEVMSIARRLLREREQAVREISRLHEQMVEAHDDILLLHAYADENFSARDRDEGDGQSMPKRDHIESVVNYVKNLHERWQAVQKTWFGSSLVNMKHKMLLVEEAWKKLRHRNHRTVATTHHPLDVFRTKLCAVRAQGGEGRLGDLPSLCSSEESIASLFPFTDDEEVKEKDDNYEYLPSSTPARPQNSVKSKYQATEKTSEILCSRNDISAITDSVFSDTLSPRIRPDEALIEKKDVESTLNLSSNSHSKSTSPKYGESSRSYWTDQSLSASLSLINELGHGEQLPKEEISARLKELALTSESGSCSVLEVIEPSSEESDTHHDEENCGEVCLNNQTEGLETKQRSLQERREIIARGEATTSSESGVDYVHSSEHLHIDDKVTHTNNEGKHFLGSETSVGAAAMDVSDKGQRNHDFRENNENYVGVTSSSTSTTNQNSSNPTFKRKGFLHKLIKPPRWPSKRKAKPIRKIDTGSVREFLDPPSTQSGNRSASYFGGDGEPHTTPESNTSSSQEYSNSSEESSIGKPTSTTCKPTELYQTISGQPDLEKKAVGNSSNSQEVEKRSLITASPSHSTSPPPIPTRRVVLSQTPTVTSMNAQNFHSDERKVGENNMNNIQKNSVTEVRSVATSEDSGIVARPASSASKSDSVSRPDSSSSSFPPFKSDYSLQKSNLSLMQDMLPTPDSSTASRMSPAPSEVSKTESALSPPSHASDVSKSESSRQASLGKGSLGSSSNSNSSKEGSASSSDYSVTLLPLKKDINVKTAAIINISCDQKVKKPLDDELSESTPDDSLDLKKERPWYELSDEESDILLPDRLTSKGVPRNSSSEDETELC